jgi:predicted adenylyl cyclase CyaB
VPRNVEIKARVRDLPALSQAVAAIADGAPTLLLQDDTFFDSPRGRLKLRVFAEGSAELISYLRSDVGGPRESRFAKAPVSDPAALVAVLDDALGTAGTVRKRRVLYRRGRTRIHLDEVEGLGSFLELEVELADGESVVDGERVARELMTRLGIAEDDLVAGAYVDLLRDRRSKNEE